MGLVGIAGLHGGFSEGSAGAGQFERTDQAQDPRQRLRSVTECVVAQSLELPGAEADRRAVAANKKG